MINHFHLLFRIKEPEKLSRFMAGLDRAYTHHHHNSYRGSGLLWQGRFKLQPVQKERYLLTCGRYIERNPVRAGIVSKASDYTWSSALFYCSGVYDGLTCEDPLYAGFGSTPQLRQASYTNFLQDFDMQEENAFRDWDKIAGDHAFAGKVIYREGRHIGRRKGGYCRGIRSLFTCA